MYAPYVCEYPLTAMKAKVMVTFKTTLHRFLSLCKVPSEPCIVFFHQEFTLSFSSSSISQCFLLDFMNIYQSESLHTYCYLFSWGVCMEPWTESLVCSTYMYTSSPFVPPSLSPLCLPHSFISPPLSPPAITSKGIYPTVPRAPHRPAGNHETRLYRGKR